MTTRTFFVMEQAHPSTDKPWWISSMVIDEEREQVRHRVEYGPFATEKEAKDLLVKLEQH